MSHEKVTPGLYQAELRATEAITSVEAAQLRGRRQVAIETYKASPRNLLIKYSPLVMSCTLLAVLWFMPNQELDNTPITIGSDELRGLIDPNTWPAQNSVEPAYDGEWSLYNDWLFYEWLAEEQLAEAY